MKTNEDILSTELKDEQLAKVVGGKNMLNQDEDDSDIRPTGTIVAEILPEINGSPK